MTTLPYDTWATTSTDWGWIDAAIGFERAPLLRFDAPDSPLRSVTISESAAARYLRQMRTPALVLSCSTAWT
jgi:hypothetical protein